MARKQRDDRGLGIRAVISLVGHISSSRYRRKKGSVRLKVERTDSTQGDSVEEMELRPGDSIYSYLQMNYVKADGQENGSESMSCRITLLPPD